MKKRRCSLRFATNEPPALRTPGKETPPMKEKSTETGTESRPAWESLEALARQGVQRLLQQLLEEEVEEVLGRRRYERRDGVEAPPGYRNGWGKPRRLSAMAGTITVRRPRVRGLEARFESWKRRRLDNLEPVYVWADGIYIKAGLEKAKAAMLVLIAALRDGRKVVLAVESGYRESTESWAALLRDLKARGLRAPQLLIADGHLGIWGAVGAVFPAVSEQRCWNHRLVNVLDTLPKPLQAEARELLTKIPYAETRAEAERQKRTFQAWATKKDVAAAGRRLDEDWGRLVTFYAFPKEHWKHLRTTNVVESPFATVRLRTEAAKRFKKVENATAVIWKTLLVAEQRFRRLDAPERLPEVAEGVVYVDGARKKRSNEKAAA